MAASFRGSKDQKTLVRAMKWLPEYYYLLLLGCGNKEQEIKAVTSNSNLDHRVRFLGFRKDIPEIMKACDIYVQSSWWEGFGLVAAEAMAAGLPVVASNVEGLSEVVGSSGLLFEPGNPEELAKKISEAFSEKKRLSILAREQVKKRFSINRFLEEHILLYQNLCNKTDF
jgi:glycosyltransferase involved in cell wall biosynthesis